MGEAAKLHRVKRAHRPSMPSSRLLFCFSCEQTQRQQPRLYAGICQSPVWIENIQGLFMFGKKYQPVAVVVDGIPSSGPSSGPSPGFPENSLDVYITE
jgi:hypothetical protein